MAPAFADIAKAAKEVLLGVRPADGVYASAPTSKITFASKTSSGVSISSNIVKKGDGVDGGLTASYSKGKTGGSVAVTPAGNVDLAIDFSSKCPLNNPFKLTTSASLPGGLSTAKLALDYNAPQFSVKSTATLTSRPLITAAAATGFKNLLLGADLAYSSSSSSITRWTLAAGYHDTKQQVGAFVNGTSTSKPSTAKLAYALKVTDSATVGAEVTKDLAGSTAPPSFALGVSQKVAAISGSGAGAIVKAKLESTGVISALFRDSLASAGALTLSVSLDPRPDAAKNPIKVGVVLEL